MVLLTIIGYPDYSLTKIIAEKLQATEIGVYDKVFPDGEFYVRLIEPEKIASSVAVVVSTLYPEQEKRLLKTLLLVDAVKRNNPLKIIALIPYLAYSRQDKVFLNGEPVSACLIVRMLRSAGVDVLLTVDVHSPRVLECFKGSSINVMVSDILVKHALKYSSNPVVIAPDRGALERASLAAKQNNLEYDYLIKQRDRVTGEVTYMPREINIEGRDVIIVDDIISTGGTIAESSNILLRNGARKIIVAATHGLLVGGAVRKLESAGVSKIILADTLGAKHDHYLIEYTDISNKLIEELSKIVSSGK